MSWYVSFIGKPENIVNALDAESLRLTGTSKEEFDEALPHLKGIISQNVNEDHQPCLRLNASGSAYTNPNNNKKVSSCTATIEILAGAFV